VIKTLNEGKLDNVISKLFKRLRPEEILVLNNDENFDGVSFEEDTT